MTVVLRWCLGSVAFGGSPVTTRRSCSLGAAATVPNLKVAPDVNPWHSFTLHFLRSRRSSAQTVPWQIRQNQRVRHGLGDGTDRVGRDGGSCVGCLA